MEKQTKDEAAAVVRAALDGNRELWVRGHKTKDGRTLDMKVELLPGEDAYRKLLETALKEAAETEMPAPGELGFDSDVWEQALDEQLASWRKSLEGGGSGKSWGRKIASAGECAGHYEDDPDSFVLRQFKVLESRYRGTGVTQEGPKSKPKTLAKKRIRAMFGVDSYRGAFHVDLDAGARIELP